MSLIICPRCHKPRLTEAETCHHCGRAEAGCREPPEFESVASLSCLVLLVLFALALVLSPLLLLVGILFR